MRLTGKFFVEPPGKTSRRPSALPYGHMQPSVIVG